MPILIIVCLGFMGGSPASSPRANQPGFLHALRSGTSENEEDTLDLSHVHFAAPVTAVVSLLPVVHVPVNSGDGSSQRPGAIDDEAGTSEAHGDAALTSGAGTGGGNAEGQEIGNAQIAAGEEVGKAERVIDGEGEDGGGAYRHHIGGEGNEDKEGRQRETKGIRREDKNCSRQEGDEDGVQKEVEASEGEGAEGSRQQGEESQVGIIPAGCEEVVEVSAGEANVPWIYTSSLNLFTGVSESAVRHSSVWFSGLTNSRVVHCCTILSGINDSSVEHAWVEHSGVHFSCVLHCGIHHSGCHRSRIHHSDVRHSGIHHCGVHHSGVHHSKVRHSGIDHCHVEHSCVDGSQIRNSKVSHSNIDNCFIKNSEVINDSIRNLNVIDNVRSDRLTAAGS